MIPVLITLGSFLLIVGAVLWVRPSPRDRRLAKLRQQCLQDGLRVQQRQVPDLSIDGRIADIETPMVFYRRYQKKTRYPGIFTILRTTGESGIYLPDGWVWENNKRLPEPHRHAIVELLQSLPEFITGIELAPDYVGVAWDERDPANYPYIVSTCESLLSV